MRHDFFGVDPDVQKPNYTDEELTELEEREKEKYPFETIDEKGEIITEEFTPYQATQEMRRMEAAMRKARSLARGYKSGGLEEQYETTKIKYSTQRKEYERFCKAMGMKTDWNRVHVDGLGKV